MSEIPLSIAALGGAYTRLWAQFSEFPTRNEVAEHIRLFKPRTLANMDYQGRGPAGRRAIGGQICYPREQVVLWLASQMKNPHEKRTFQPTATRSGLDQPFGSAAIKQIPQKRNHMTITVREAKAALAQMKKLTPARPRLDDDAKLSLKKTVLFMASELIAMNKRGFTMKELAAGLQVQNIHIKPATLNRYLNK